MKQELLYNEIEKLMKLFIGHRCALDFDSGFANLQTKEAKKVDVCVEDCGGSLISERSQRTELL
jgi:hypothetical protein